MPLQTRHQQPSLDIGSPKLKPAVQLNLMMKESVSVEVVAAALAMVVVVSASDPDPLQDFCVADLGSWTHENGYGCQQGPGPEEGEERGLRVPRAAHGQRHKDFGGTIKTALVHKWPALNTQGISWGRIDYAVDGLNNLHWHPRASEILYCQEGTLFVGFMSTGDNRFWYNTLEPGDLVLVPRGLLQFELNVGKVPAMAQIAHNSQDGGIHSTFGSYLIIPDNILRKGFDLDEQTVQHLKQVFRETQLQSSVSVDHTE